MKSPTVCAPWPCLYCYATPWHCLNRKGDVGSGGVSSLTAGGLGTGASGALHLHLRCQSQGLGKACKRNATPCRDVMTFGLTCRGDGERYARGPADGTCVAQ